MNIPITKVCFDQTEKDAVSRVLDSGWVVQGPNVSEFEKLFAEYTGSKYAKATSNCTTSLHLALESMGVGKGDKVIVPSFTYIASANSVEYTGAEVVFCDVDLKTFNIDVLAMEKLIKKDRSIKAIMPVNLFGLCADLPTICNIAAKNNLKVIEDSACAFDSWIGNKHSGTFGDSGCFSFHPRKAITTGEGGMVITDNEAIAKSVSSLRDHGASKSDLERHTEQGGSLLPAFKVRGYNYRMTDIQGAIGVCQMKKAKDIMTGRRKIANRYYESLMELRSINLPYVPKNYVHGYQSFVCLFTDGEDLSSLTKDKVDKINIKRNAIMARLEEANIATRQGTHAVHTLEYYKNRYGLSDQDFINSYASDRLSISLPLYASMTDEEFAYVVDKIKKEAF